MSLPWLSDPRRPLTNPRSLPNLAFWHPTDLTASTTSNDLRIDASNRVSLHADKSGNSEVNCLVTNGVAGNYASFTALTAFGTGDFTVSTRVIVSSLASVSALFGGPDSNTMILRLETNGTIRSVLSGVGNNSASTGAVSVFVPVTITYIRSGAVGTYYLEGASVGTTADTRNYSSGTDKVGVTGAGGAVNPFSGNIFWVHVYARALVGAEITNDAAGIIQATPALNQDFRTNNKLATSVTATTGQTVTINSTGAQGARICGERDLVNLTAASQPIYCFLPETRMLFKSGFKKVEDSVDGELPYQIDGKFASALHRWSMPYDGEAVRFSVRGCMTAGLTGEHRCLRVDGKKVRGWRRRETAYVARMGRPYTEDTQERDRGYSRKLDLLPDWVEAKDLKNGDFMLLAKPVLDSSTQFIRVDGVTSNYSNKCPATIEIDNEMAFVLGWWLAEGSFSTDDRKRIKGLVFTLSGDEVLIATKIEEILERRTACSASIHLFHDKNVCSVNVNGAAFARAIDRMFGRGAKHKGIPDEILNSTPEVLRSFVRAYADGDGCKIEKRASREVRISTISEKIVAGMIVASMKLGAPPCITERNKDGRHTCFNISFAGNDADIVFDGAAKAEKTQRKWMEDEHYFYTPITSIEHFHYTGEVWDFTTKTETLSIPFVVHNCPWAGVNYGYVGGVAANTFSCPLANDTYDLAITYLDGTTDTDTLVVTGGQAAMGGTAAKLNAKGLRQVVVSKSGVTRIIFDPSRYVSGTELDANTPVVQLTSDGSTANRRAEATPGAPGAIAGMAASFPFEFDVPASNPAVGGEILTVGPSATIASIAQAFQVGMGAARNLVIRQNGAVFATDFLRLEYTGFGAVYGGRRVRGAVVFDTPNTTTNPKIYLNGVDVSASFSLTSGGSGNWMPLTLDTTKYLVGLSSPAWAIVPHAPILGALTAAEVLAWTQTGRLPAWCEVGTGSAVALESTNFSNGLNGWSTTSQWNLVGNYLNHTGTSNFGQSAKTFSAIALSAGRGYRYKIVVNAVSVGAFRLRHGTPNLTTVVEINAPGTYEGVLNYTQGGSVLYFQNAANAQLECSITSIEIVSLGPIAKWVCTEGSATGIDYGASGINLTLTSGITATAATAATMQYPWLKWRLNAGTHIVTRTCIYGNGSSHVLKSPPYQFAQPCTIYWCGEMTSWTASDYLFDGNATSSGALIQTTSTPQVNMSAGSSVAANTGMALRTKGVYCAVFNGANSSLTFLRTPPTTGDAGTAAMNGFTTLARGAGDAGWLNGVTYEQVGFSVAHDVATRNRMMLYFGRKGGFAV
jgi:hypothetical protein